MNTSIKAKCEFCPHPLHSCWGCYIRTGPRVCMCNHGPAYLRVEVREK